MGVPAVPRGIQSAMGVFVVQLRYSWGHLSTNAADTPDVTKAHGGGEGAGGGVCHPKPKNVFTSNGPNQICKFRFFPTMQSESKGGGGVPLLHPWGGGATSSRDPSLQPPNPHPTLLRRPHSLCHTPASPRGNAVSVAPPSPSTPMDWRAEHTIPRTPAEGPRQR